MMMWVSKGTCAYECENLKGQKCQACYRNVEHELSCFTLTPTMRAVQGRHIAEVDKK